MCELSGELYENLQIFVDLHSVSKVLRRYGAFLVKTFWGVETRKNSNVPQMLLAFEETVWSKKYFYWWTVRLHLNFYVQKIWRFHTRPSLAKISLWSVWRDLREAKCVNSGELYENLQIFVDLHSVSKVFKALRRLLKIKNFRIEEWRHA